MADVSALIAEARSFAREGRMAPAPSHSLILALADALEEATVQGVKNSAQNPADQERTDLVQVDVDESGNPIWGHGTPAEHPEPPSDAEREELERERNKAEFNAIEWRVRAEQAERNAAHWQNLHTQDMRRVIPQRDAAKAKLARIAEYTDFVRTRLRNGDPLDAGLIRMCRELDAILNDKEGDRG